MKMVNALLAAAMMTGGILASSANAQITYTGNDVQDDVDVSYSITTNGKIGVLSLGDITASSITFSGREGSRYGAFSPFTAINSLYFSNTNDDGISPVRATTADLLFNFAGGGGLNFSTYNCVAIDTACTPTVTAPSDLVAGIVYALASQSINDGDAVVYEHNGRATRELDNPDRSNYRLADGTFTVIEEPTEASFATAAVSDVPEPASWAMMVMGFGVIGGAARYRRKSVKVTLA